MIEVVNAKDCAVIAPDQMTNRQLQQAWGLIKETLDDPRVDDPVVQYRLKRQQHEIERHCEMRRITLTPIQS